MDRISEKEGRKLFGLNSAAYDRIRPPYPSWMYKILIAQKALYPGVATLEVGAGNGLATRILVEQGATPLTLVEPDDRFGPLLQDIACEGQRECKIMHESFEDARLEKDSFDLALVATTFHWLSPEFSVSKLSEVIRTGGYVALIWNVFQDLNKKYAFHDATADLFNQVAKSPSDPVGQVPFALDRKQREQEFSESGSFELVMYAEDH